MKTKYYALFVALFAFSALFAQSYQVNGIVSDGDNQPLPSVSVMVKGTTRGVATDFDGKYSIEVSKGETLVFTFVGMASKDVEMDGTSIVNVQLANGVELDEVVMVGSRNPARTATDTPVPVDVINIAELTTAGPQTDVNQILNYVAPSFTSNTQTVSDGTDHIDPASLRGMGPDQVLVLINGKRRHTSSLLNVNGTVGAGSVGTDMNAIPTAAIKNIEVLRDGAAAQYGSDAIGGVINIVLNNKVNELAVTINNGANMSKNSNKYGEGGTDGQKFQVDVNYGLPLGDKGGFINFTGSMSTRAATNRSDSMGKDIFLGYHAVERVARTSGADVSNLSMTDVQFYAQAVEDAVLSPALKAQIAAAGDITTLRGLLDDDITDAELAVRGKTRDDFRMRIGQSDLKEGKFMANMSIPVGDNGSEFYAFGGMTYRRGLAAGFYRRPAYTDGRGNTAAFENGFLPEIGSDIKDKSLAIGIKGKLGDWNSDLSNSFGINTFDFNIVNTSNSTLGTATKRDFQAGGFSFAQNTTNWDISKFNEGVFNGLNLAFGAEHRIENYQINAGEEASWASYDINGELVTDTTPDALKVKSFFGNTTPGGSQVFPGFRPENELSKYRTSYAFYADTEIDFSEKFMIDAALRYENYSDFGSTVNWKLASRYKVSDNFSVRGAMSTGFRAPSLHQIYYNATATQFIGGIPYEVGTFANNSRIASLLGIEKLRQERANNASIGFTAKIKNFTVTVDAYNVTVYDRVVLTGNFANPHDGSELEGIFNDAGANKAKFLMNAVNTNNKGIDLVISHKMKLGNGATFRNDFSFTTSKVDTVGAVHVTDKLVGQEATVFGERQYYFLTKAMPATKWNLTHNYNNGKWNFMLRNAYFGDVTDPDAHHTVYAGKVITDLSIGYKYGENTTFTVGANNLLDVYPDEVPVSSNYGRQFIYSRRTSQFGMNGRYVFARLSFNLK
jgi:iron complex outermembrane receptor protein